jgi:hypothetical protein
VGEKERDMTELLVNLAPFAVSVALAWGVITITRRNQ